METQTKSKSNQKWIIILLVLLLLLLGVVLAVVLLRGGDSAVSDENTPKIGYAADATVMLDQESLQAAMDEAMENARNSAVGLSYMNNAYSTDGVNFECYIANSERNLYDMYLNIYADVELKDQIYLSGLVPPGSGFEQITLEHPLDIGDHTVYVVLTQVETDAETQEQTIMNQVVHTMEFHVTVE